MAQPNDLILTLARHGDDLDIVRIELIPSENGNNTIEMEDINNIQFNLFNSDAFDQMDDEAVATCRCVWEPASPETGHNYDGYLDGGLVIVSDDEVTL